MSNHEIGNRQSRRKNPQNWLDNLRGIGNKVPLPGGKSDQNSNERQMNKLKRQELLQILVTQSKEIDRLKKELQETKEQLADRELKISASGSLAEASLKLYDVFNSAQKAADLYLENLKLRAEADMPETDDVTEDPAGNNLSWTEDITEGE